MQRVVLWGLALLLMGCDAFRDLSVVPRSSPDSDMSLRYPSSVDSGYSATSCSAATGMVGVLLKDSQNQDFCIDFGKGTVTDAKLKTRDWLLNAVQLGCSGFSVIGGTLTVSSPSDYLKADCQAILPTLTVPVGTTRIIVSIVQDLSFYSDSQSVQIEERITKQKYGWSGLNNTNAPSAATLEFNPEPLIGSFSVALHARNMDTSAAPLPYWQIRSIAVLGIP